MHVSVRCECLCVCICPEHNCVSVGQSVHMHTCTLAGCADVPHACTHCEEHIHACPGRACAPDTSLHPCTERTCACTEQRACLSRGSMCACPCRHRLCIRMMSPRAEVLVRVHTLAGSRASAHSTRVCVCPKAPNTSICLHGVSEPALSFITPLPCVPFGNGCVARRGRRGRTCSPGHWEGAPGGCPIQERHLHPPLGCLHKPVCTRLGPGCQ